MNEAAWLEEAKRLPVGKHTRWQCECTNSRNDKSSLITHSIKGYSLFCFRCDNTGFVGKGVQTLEELRKVKELNAAALATSRETLVNLPEDFVHDIPLNGRLWLYKAGITESRWKEKGIGYSPTLERVIIPVYTSTGELSWYQGRATLKGQLPKYLQPAMGREKILYEAPCTSDLIKNTVVVTEDILSSIVVSNVQTSVSTLGTKLSVEQCNKISEYQNVIVWLDSDKAGVNGSKKMVKQLSLLTDVHSVVTEKDPKFLTKQQIKEVLESV